MSQETPNLPPDQTPALRGGWRRPLAYLLIIGGVLLTFFNGEVGRGLGIPVLAIQIGSLGFLLAGAALFYSVRVPPLRRMRSPQNIAPPEIPPEPEVEKEEIAPVKEKPD